MLHFAITLQRQPSVRFIFRCLNTPLVAFWLSWQQPCVQNGVLGWGATLNDQGPPPPKDFFPTYDYQKLGYIYVCFTVYNAVHNSKKRADKNNWSTY